MRIFVLVGIVFWGMFLLENAEACRLSPPPSSQSNVFWVHLEGLCRSKDLHNFAVKGADVLKALQNGKSLDVEGALISGDIMLDDLPLQPIVDVPNLPLDIQQHLQRKGLKSVRVIPESLRIRESQFEKVLATNLVKDVLIILGDVEISGTTFLQSVDLSRVIFVKPFVFTNVQVGFEGFFIGTQFEQSADFSQTVFGTHSRFHKARFRASALFPGVQFTGVAEFLGVQFQQTANFSQVKFLSGTGFSGSIFHGPVDFSEVETHQEIYFRFSEFKQQASFRKAEFQTVVDFSNSYFASLEGSPDFSEAEFAVQPNFSDSNFSIEIPVTDRRLNPQTQWMVLGALLIMAVVYLWTLKRKSQENSA